MEPDKIYASKADGYIPEEDYDAFFAQVVDCGWAPSVEIIKVSEVQLMEMDHEELKMLQRFMQEPATHHKNTVVEALDVQDFLGTALKVRITHDVPCITTLSEVKKDEPVNLRPYFGFDDNYDSSRHMYDRFANRVTIQMGDGSIFEGYL